MVSDIALEKSDDRELRLTWSRRWTLTHRILAVNIFALAIFAGSLFYLDSFRERLTAARVAQIRTEARVAADALSIVTPELHAPLLARIGAESRTRLRAYAPRGEKVLDSWSGRQPTYSMRDPLAEPWVKDVARWLDGVIDMIVGAARPPTLDIDHPDSLAAWPEAREAMRVGETTTMVRLAPEGTPFLSAAAPLKGNAAGVLLLTVNARDIRAVVRDERVTLGIVLLATLLLSVLLSLFLARTVAVPLRRLAYAAHRVRQGRAREVRVPRLPARKDEIGLLARALHDMTNSLRQRIDATEAFAADVTHELKNPLASLRSAVDSLEKVEDPELRRQLLDVVRHDVVRLDRLIVDIADVSRLDAELSRARFAPVDLGAMIEAHLPGWEALATPRGVTLAFARPRVGTAVMMGEEARLARALGNLVDNAISFSPPGGLVEVAATRIGEEVELSVEDEGAGVPAAAREAIFNRFHSIRPDGEAFGRHSGLGLAIAKAIVDGHGGAIAAEDRHDGRAGARFVIRFAGAAS